MQCNKDAKYAIDCQLNFSYWSKRNCPKRGWGQNKKVHECKTVINDAPSRVANYGVRSAPRVKSLSVISAAASGSMKETRSILRSKAGLLQFLAKDWSNKGSERKAHSRKAGPFCTRPQFSLIAHPCTPECALGHEVMYGALSQGLLAQNAVKCSDTIRELARKVQPTVRQEIGGAWNNR